MGWGDYWAGPLVSPCCILLRRAVLSHPLVSRRSVRGDAWVWWQGYISLGRLSTFGALGEADPG